MVWGVALSACVKSVVSPLSQDEKRLYHIASMDVTQSGLFGKRIIARKIREEVGGRWRYWLSGPRRLDVTVDIHPDTAGSWNRVIQATKGDTLVARIMVTDEKRNVLADYVHYTKLESYLSTNLPDSQDVRDAALARQFVAELQVIFHHASG